MKGQTEHMTHLSWDKMCMKAAVLSFMAFVCMCATLVVFTAMFNKDRHLSCSSSMYESEIYFLTSSLFLMCIMGQMVITLQKRSSSVSSLLVLINLVYGFVTHACLFALPSMFMLQAYNSDRCLPTIEIFSWLSHPLLMLAFFATCNKRSTMYMSVVYQECAYIAIEIACLVIPSSALRILILICAMIGYVHSKSVIWRHDALSKGMFVAYVSFPLVHLLGELNAISPLIELCTFAVADVALKVCHMAYLEYCEVDKHHDIGGKQITKKRETVEKMFVRYIFHEVRNPLSCLGAALEDMDVQDVDVPYVKHLRNGMTSLGRLLDDLKELIELQEGSVVLEESIVNMHAIIVNCIRRTGDCHDFVISSNPNSQCVIADEYRMCQVVCAALLYAHQHTNESNPISISLSQTDGYGNQVDVRMCFNFLPTRRSTMKSDFEASNVKLRPDNICPELQIAFSFGLRLAEYVVEMYGGSVYVEDVDQGLLSVVVAFQLVKHTPKFVAQKARIEAVSETALSIEPNTSRVLIVDDNKLQVKLLGKICTDSGYIVECAYDGVEAVEKIRQRGAGFYSIVFCDIVMPKMNGVEATLRMRKIDSAVPIYAISANGFDSDFEEIVRAGATAGFSKPVPRDTIYTLLTQASRMKNN